MEGRKKGCSDGDGDVDGREEGRFVLLGRSLSSSRFADADAVKKYKPIF
jgi:hypothetical protein